MKIILMLCLALLLTGCGESSNVSENGTAGSTVEGSTSGESSITGGSTSGGGNEEAAKAVLVNTGQMIANAAQNAYMLGILNGDIVDDSAAACYSVSSLIDMGYLDPSSEKYSGGVLVTADGQMQVWLTDGKFKIEGQEADALTSDMASSGSTTSTNCGGKASINF